MNYLLHALFHAIFLPSLFCLFKKYLLSVYIAELHFQILSNFPFQCFRSLVPQVAYLSCAGFIVSFLGHAHLLLFCLGSYIYLPVDTYSFSAFTLSFPLFYEIFHATNFLGLSASKEDQSSENPTKLWSCAKEQSSLCRSLFFQFSRQICLSIKI